MPDCRSDSTKEVALRALRAFVFNPPPGTLPNQQFPLLSTPMAVPVFGFLAFTSGSFEGAIIRDMRLANALHARGHKVVIYWMMDRNPDLVARGVTQRMLCRG